MQKDILRDMLVQNRATCEAVFQQITGENASLRLNSQTASVGFIFRHVGETMNLFGLFFGLPTDVKNTTMGQADTGQGQDVEVSRQQVAEGYARLQGLVENTADLAWSEKVDTPFFGPVSRSRLFAHVLFHTAHHVGQITLTLSKGSINS
jgi:uncharacterized damage-inducible protein DinB